ncbi:MAG TPA: hypothetical protein VLH10_03260 [Yinghuangia sp.]|nr:hypothetical protein [Yinghuangia sp.]
MSGTTAGRLRPRWFAGQLVGPEDLAQTGVWLVERMRRHNRLLHGWGVVCGAAVSTVPDHSDRGGNGNRNGGDNGGATRPWLLDVTAGYVLGPHGDEIVIDRRLRVDVRDVLPDGTAGCPPPADPWCAPLRGRREPGRTYHLAVRYDECLTAPVPAAVCGCDDQACEYSRVREGFVLGVLDRLPEAYHEDDRSGGENMPAAAALGGSLAGSLRCSSEIEWSGTRACPPCPTSPWVVLADFTAEADGTLWVDQLRHRRFTASFGAFGFFCSDNSDNSDNADGSDRSDSSDRSSDNSSDNSENNLDARSHGSAGPRPGSGPEWSPVVRRTLADSFTEVHGRHVLDAEGPAHVSAMPARHLRGVGATRELARIVGDRSVAELARGDADAFTAAAEAAGVATERVQALLERARMVMRLTSS